MEEDDDYQLQLALALSLADVRQLCMHIRRHAAAADTPGIAYCRHKGRTPAPSWKQLLQWQEPSQCQARLQHKQHHLQHRRLKQQHPCSLWVHLQQQQVEQEEHHLRPEHLCQI